MRYYIPDLIVEVTAACNRACQGCYAPNIVTNKPAEEIYVQSPELFLDFMRLNDGFNQMPMYPYFTAVRGGEPSLHPKLSSLLLLIQRKSQEVMLETHARWLLPKDRVHHSTLIEAVKNLGTIIKISFDKMHGLSKADLQTITTFLEEEGIDYRIAITESTISEYLLTRSLCPWVADDKMIFQPKATRAEDLVKPDMGVINVKGEYKANLNSRWKFSEAKQFGVAQ